VTFGEFPSRFRSVQNVHAFAASEEMIIDSSSANGTKRTCPVLSFSERMKGRLTKCIFDYTISHDRDFQPAASGAANPSDRGGGGA
jgi:hypothetical protein